MTREEEKYQAAENAWNLKGIKNKEQKIPYKLGFLEGFDYVDQHPIEGLWNSKKVIEFIKNNVREYLKSGVFHVDDFINDLRKAMED